MGALPRRLGGILCAACLVTAATARSRQGSAAQAHSSSSSTNLGELVRMIHGKADSLRDSAGMRGSFRSFTSTHHLEPGSVPYGDFVIVWLLFEATRDAGFWNVHWTITDQPPNSDKIWQQWLSVSNPSLLSQTASAECDELSALFAFLVEREGVKGVGLFWPAPNHTVAVWVLHPATGPAIRVVVPTSQIFLEASDSFDTKKFDPWSQKRSTNTRAGTPLILLNFRNRFSTFSFSRSTSTAAPPTRRSSNYGTCEKAFS
jgi:hypothetical protein